MRFQHGSVIAATLTPPPATVESGAENESTEEVEQAIEERLRENPSNADAHRALMELKIRECKIICRNILKVSMIQRCSSLRVHLLYRNQSFIVTRRRRTSSIVVKNVPPTMKKKLNLSNEARRNSCLPGFSHTPHMPIRGLKILWWTSCKISPTGITIQACKKLVNQPWILIMDLLLNMVKIEILTCVRYQLHGCFFNIQKRLW